VPSRTGPITLIGQISTMLVSSVGFRPLLVLHRLAMHALVLVLIGASVSWVNVEPTMAQALSPVGAVAWGSAYQGALGNGSTQDSGTPVYTLGLANALALAAGWDHGVAILPNQTLRAWGDNSQGQLGDGTTIGRTTPAAVASLTGVSRIAAGYVHTLALKTDGTVWAWGRNFYGELGDGTTVQRMTPVQVTGPRGAGVLSGVAAVAANSSEHSVALKTDGTVWSWGLNSSGQLGDGTTKQRTSPVQAGTLTGITAIAAGNATTLALKNDGTVWAWGSNQWGQVGDGTTTDRKDPTQVKGTNGAGFLTGVVAIGTGYGTSFAVTNDGRAWSWGRNARGEACTGTFTEAHTPSPISSLNGITSIQGGFFHTALLRNDGTVWTCGDNWGGTLGTGRTDQFYMASPVQVISTTGTGTLSGVTVLASGYATVYAISPSQGPSASISRYISNADVFNPSVTVPNPVVPSEQVTIPWALGCNQGGAGGTRPVSGGLVVLDFGQAWQDPTTGAYGANIFDPNATFESVDSIRYASEQFLSGYWSCSPANGPVIYLVIGTSNYNLGAIASGHGQAWAGIVQQVSQWITQNNQGSQEIVRGGMDFEPNYSSATAARSWADGFGSVAGYFYYNYGSCDGCTASNPLNYGAAQAPASPGAGLRNGWTRDDLLYVSEVAPAAFAFPEIYNNTIAWEWQNISAYSIRNRTYTLYLWGPLTQHQACVDRPNPTFCTGTDDAPDASWTNLWVALNENPDTAQPTVPYSSDLTYNNDPSKVP
jgi:alpha-tubulin suppressor-like RCC1 family protein